MILKYSILFMVIEVCSAEKAIPCISLVNVRRQMLQALPYEAPQFFLDGYLS